MDMAQWNAFDDYPATFRNDDRQVRVTQGKGDVDMAQWNAFDDYPAIIDAFKNDDR